MSLLFRNAFVYHSLCCKFDFVWLKYCYPTFFPVTFNTFFPSLHFQYVCVFRSGISFRWYMCVYVLSHFSCIWLFATLSTIALQAPLPMGFSRQEYWSELPFPSPEIFPTQGLNPGLPHCRQTLYRLSHQRSPVSDNNYFLFHIEMSEAYNELTDCLLIKSLVGLGDSPIWVFSLVSKKKSDTSLLNMREPRYVTHFSSMKIKVIGVNNV